MANIGFGTGHLAGHGKTTESTEQRAARLVREQALLDEAREEFQQGFVMDEDEVKAWLDALGNDEQRPLPRVYRNGQN